jgi:hypothetical protein
VSAVVLLAALPVAHEAGVRHMAMEALYGPYLAQPDMKALIGAAEELGWRLIPYEVDQLTSPNEREEGQARNLAAALAQLPPETPILVWCGIGHLWKTPPREEWIPMACRFWEMTEIEPFSIDQTVTVEFRPDTTRFNPRGGAIALGHPLGGARALPLPQKRLWPDAAGSRGRNPGRLLIQEIKVQEGQPERASRHQNV